MTTATETRIIALPFEGLFHSALDELIDNEIEYEVEAGRVPSSEVLYDNFDREGFAEAAGESTVCRHNTVAKDILEGLELGLEFDRVQSPREYNFTSDMLMAKMPLASVQALFQLSEDQNHACLRQSVRERFTSRSGFISFYSADLDDWLEKPLEEWDHHELGTLYGSLMLDQLGTDWEEEHIFEPVRDDFGSNGVISGLFDWVKIDAAIEENEEAE